MLVAVLRRCGRLCVGGATGWAVISSYSAVRADGGMPQFNLLQSRFDQSNFWGRLQQINVQLDPMKLFVSVAEIDAAVALIDGFKQGRTGATDAQLWAAKELIECRVHPDTGQTIFTPFCFAAYTPMQPPIIVGLLVAASPASIAFWQWFNQSYNAAVFYSNKSVSSQMPDSQIAMSYCAAVTAAISIGLGDTPPLAAWQCSWAADLRLDQCYAGTRALGARLGSGS
jgi:hypothetical protein